MPFRRGAVCQDPKIKIVEKKVLKDHAYWKLLNMDIQAGA
jgi:hypothetical protein